MFYKVHVKAKLCLTAESKIH